jgi:hypothetical protein
MDELHVVGDRGRSTDSGLLVEPGLKPLDRGQRLGLEKCFRHRRLDDDVDLVRHVQMLASQSNGPANRGGLSKVSGEIGIDLDERHEQNGYDRHDKTAKKDRTSITGVERTQRPQGLGEPATVAVSEPRG